jgi:hypothetical protein
MDLLVQKILMREPAAILMAEEMGSSAGLAVKTLAEHEDAAIRQLAVRCLNRSGIIGGEEIFVNALTDDSPSVRAAALNALDRRADAQVYWRLLEVYDRVSDSQHRQEIALMLGKIGEANLSDLKRAFSNEQDLEALEGCLAALAKLGDAGSQAEFLNRLVNAKDRALKRFLEYADYIGQIWVLRGLATVLNNQTFLNGSGVCRPPESLSEYVRACDQAVNLIAEIAGLRFSFPVRRMTNYTDSQLAEVRRFLAALS